MLDPYNQPSGPSGPPSGVTPSKKVNNHSNYKVRPDDWTCPSCHNINFSWRSQCHRVDCNETRPECFGGPAHDFSKLVERIKTFQRQSIENKEGWGHYCDRYGDNVRDPSKHTQQFLEAAVSQLMSETLKTEPAIPTVITTTRKHPTKRAASREPNDVL